MLEPCLQLRTAVISLYVRHIRKYNSGAIRLLHVWSVISLFFFSPPPIKSFFFSVNATTSSKFLGPLEEQELRAAMVRENLELVETSSGTNLFEVRQERDT